MKIRQLGSSIGDAECRQHLTTFLINDCIAIDAGCLGLLAPVANQQRVEHVLISHSHIDHIATLPLFLDNVFQPNRKSPAIYASADVWATLTGDVMNERLWPDLSRIAGDDFKFYSKVELFPEIPVQINGLTITPVSVNHIVPTFGFLIEDEQTSVVIATDTGPTAKIWELAGTADFRRKLQAVFLECSFPGSHEWLAETSKHLCPRLFAREIAKVGPGNAFLLIAVHLKASMFDETVAELQALHLKNLMIGGRDQSWDL